MSRKFPKLPFNSINVGEGRKMEGKFSTGTQPSLTTLPDRKVRTEVSLLKVCGFPELLPAGILAPG